MDHTTTQCVNSFVGGSVRSPRRLIAFATVVLTVVLLLVLIPPRNHEETGTNPSRNNALLLHTTKQSYVDNPDNKQHLSALQAKTRTRATTSNNNNNNPKNKSNTVTRSLLSEEELQQLLENIKGNDNRLFRWDAQKLTVKRREFHGCDQLIQAATVVTQSDASVRARSLAMEFLTFCITDSPEQRQRFSTVKDIHTAVIALVTSSNARVSSLACHLIYISSFSNKVNHQTFLEHNVVQALANVILNKDSTSAQIMWAAAALQNVAASYCATEDDGRCYWKWNPTDTHVVLDPSSAPMVSDGSLARQQMLSSLEDSGLVETLVQMACTGPVHGQASDTNVFPGENDVLGRDETNPHLIAWAATGALKNLALDPTSKLQLEPALPCMCHLQTSPDWLEGLKSRDLLHFMRRGDPCWFRQKQGLLCIDQDFLDDEGYHCGEYEDATSQECQAKDVHTGVSATQSCCACGGGTSYTESDENN